MALVASFMPSATEGSHDAIIKPSAQPASRPIHMFADATCSPLSCRTAVATTPSQPAQDGSSPIPRPLSEPRLPELVSSLLSALRGEAARGHTLSAAAQEPGSFARLDGAVRGLMASYASSNPGDWRRYAAFNEHHYVRHLLYGDEDCELLLLCWRRGQVSRVHNHGDSHCWLALLDGDVREVQYVTEASRAAAAARGGAGPVGGAAIGGEGSEVAVVATQTTDMRVGDVGYINDRLALHSVGCHEREGEAGGCADGDTAGAVTLHLYCPPIRRVKIVEGSRVTERTPGYFTRHNVLQQAQGRGGQEGA